MSKKNDEKAKKAAKVKMKRAAKARAKKNKAVTSSKPKKVSSSVDRAPEYDDEFLKALLMMKEMFEQARDEEMLDSMMGQEANPAPNRKAKDIPTYSEEIPNAITVDDAVFIPDTDIKKISRPKKRTAKERQEDRFNFSFGTPASGHITFTPKMFEAYCTDDMEGAGVMGGAMDVILDVSKDWEGPLYGVAPGSPVVDNRKYVFDHAGSPAILAACTVPEPNDGIYKFLEPFVGQTVNAFNLPAVYRGVQPLEKEIGKPADSLKRFVAYDNHFYDLLPDIDPEHYVSIMFIKLMDVQFVRAIRMAGSENNKRHIAKIREKHLRAQTHYLQTHLIAMQDSLQGKELPKPLF